MMMDVLQAFKDGEPLAVTLDAGNSRVIAELWSYPGGLAYADVGWPEASFHPFHLLPGQVTGSGPWQIGEATIEVMTEDHPGVESWSLWRSWLETDEGSRYTRDVATQLASEDLNTPLNP